MTDTDELITWFRATLDTLERLALAVQKETGPEWPAGDELLSGTIHTDQAGWILVGPYESDLSWDMRRYLSALGPKAVLAQIAAKRRILAEHEIVDPGEEWQYCRVCHDNHAHDAMPAPCPTLRLLAEPLATYPGYREEWRP